MEIKEEAIINLTKSINDLGKDLVDLEFTFIICILCGYAFIFFMIKYYPRLIQNRYDQFNSEKADMFDNRGDFKGLLAYCEKFLKKFPNNEYVNFYTGLAYYRLGQLEKSKYYFENSIVINPHFRENAEAYINEIGSMQSKNKSSSAN